MGKREYTVFVAGLVLGGLILSVASASIRPAAGQVGIASDDGPVQQAAGPIGDALQSVLEAAAAGMSLTAPPIATVGDVLRLELGVPGSVDLPEVLALEFVPPRDPAVNRHVLTNPPARSPSVEVPDGCDLLIALGYAREPETRSEEGRAKICPRDVNGDGDGDSTDSLLSTDDPPGTILDFARDPMVAINPALMALLHEQLETVHTDDIAGIHALLQDHLEGIETILDDVVLVSQLPPSVAVHACASVAVDHGPTGSYSLPAGSGEPSCIALSAGAAIAIPLVPGLADGIAPAAFKPSMLEAGGAAQVVNAGLVDEVRVDVTVTLTAEVPGLDPVEVTRTLSLSQDVPQLPIPPMAFAFGGQDFGPRDNKDDHNWYLIHAAVPTDSVFGSYAGVLDTVQNLLSLVAKVRGTVQTLETIAGFVAPGWVTDLKDSLDEVVKGAPLGGTVKWAGVAFTRGDRASLSNDLVRNCSEGAHSAMHPTDIYCGGVDRRAGQDDIGLNDELYSVIAVGSARTWCWYENDDFRGAVGRVALNTPSVAPVVAIYPDVSVSFGPEFTPSGVGTSSGLTRPDGSPVRANDGMSSFRWVAGGTCN